MRIDGATVAAMLVIVRDRAAQCDVLFCFIRSDRIPDQSSSSSSSSSSNSSSASGWSGSPGLKKRSPRPIGACWPPIARRFRRARSSRSAASSPRTQIRDSRQASSRRERVLRVLGHPLEREPEEVDPVARGEVELELVGLLEELDRQGQQVGRGEGEVILEDAPSRRRGSGKPRARVGWSRERM